ncbi:hypothetical protein E2F50_12485 [Rhizobium deserti]|uniref:Succinoglycan biosynthesis protein exop n=1 Tax=Rhizobium deserti TaxID=2547961 RepID=A0A4R5UGM1_9HYPH|nr:hypothetical protein [Rhizobium deserti]TDK35080.1 hypothetical protein E2F50_12485 [Rhizobium deserti]
MEYFEGISGDTQADGGRDSARPRRRRSVLLAIGLAGMVGAALPVFVQQMSAPSFVAKTELKVETASEGAVTSALAKLRSKANLDNLVRAFNLSKGSEFAIDRSGFAQVVYDILSGGGMTVAEAEADLRSRLSDAIALDYDKAHGAVAISVTAAAPEEARQLATMLGSTFAAGIDTAAEQQVPDAVLDGLRQTLERAEATLSGFLAKVDDKRLAELRRVQTDSQSLVKDVAQAEADLAQMRRKVEQAGAMTLATVLGKPLPDSLEFTGLEYQRQRHVEAKLAVDQLSGSLGPRHPRLVAAQGALEDVRADIQQSLKQLVASLQRDEATAAKRFSELKTRQATLRGDKQTAEAAERLAALETTVNEARQNYLEGQQRRRSTSMQPVQVKAQVVKPASAQPVQPSLPDMLTKSALGGLAGLLLGAACAWIRRRRFDEAEGHETSETETSQPASPVSEIDLLADEDFAELDLIEDDAPVVFERFAANDHPLPANQTPLADHIRELLMANRRPAAESQLPPLVAAVLARGSAVETVVHEPRSRANAASREALDLAALRREMAQLCEKVQQHSGRRQAARR